MLVSERFVWVRQADTRISIDVSLANSIMFGSLKKKLMQGINGAFCLDVSINFHILLQKGHDII